MFFCSCVIFSGCNESMPSPARELGSCTYQDLQFTQIELRTGDIVWVARYSDPHKDNHNITSVKHTAGKFTTYTILVDEDGSVIKTEKVK